MAESNKDERGLRRAGHFADLAACVAAVGLSVYAYVALPGRDPLRMLLVAPMFLFVPGYLLVEAVRSTKEPLRRRAAVALVAPGASLALMAMLALVTAWLPGGFHPTGIVAMATVSCVGLAVAAAYRRIRILTSISRPPAIRPGAQQFPRPVPRQMVHASMPTRPVAPPPSAPRPVAPARQSGPGTAERNRKQPPRPYPRPAQTGR